MKYREFQRLSPRQQHVMLLAMLVREELEPLHCGGLTTQDQMRQLNEALRPALYNAVTFLEEAPRDPVLAESLARLVQAIPSYWEIPGRDESLDIERAA